MRAPFAALFSAVILAAATLFSATLVRPGLRIVGVQMPRHAWILENPAAWVLSNWLWMAFVFSWMLVLVYLMWTYLPAHRVASMLESGLLIIAAALLLGGVVTWMTALPVAMSLPRAYELVPLVDGLALGFLGAGFFMGGIVTAWIGLDLIRLSPLNRLATGCSLAAGVLALPSPFLFPTPWHLPVAAVCWLAWCLYLGLRRDLPGAYPEYRGLAHRQ